MKKGLVYNCKYNMTLGEHGPEVSTLLGEISKIFLEEVGYYSLVLKNA